MSNRLLLFAHHYLFWHTACWLQIAPSVKFTLGMFFGMKHNIHHVCIFNFIPCYVRESYQNDMVNFSEISHSELRMRRGISLSFFSVTVYFLEFDFSIR